jgi:putative glutamine amidotransferase
MNIIRFSLFLFLIVSSTGAAFAGKTLFVGISESFPMGENASKVMVNADYAYAISKGGHIPVVIPRYGSDAMFDKLVEKLDVLVMTGGEDFDPAIYDEKRSPKLGTVSTSRDDFDIRLLNAARRRRLPVVGICRGCQLLNIAFGGSLWQDLPSEYPANGVQHRNVNHRIDIDPSSRLAEVLGTTNLVVNSFHHQAVKRLAPGFKIVARSPEGVVEAIESSEYPAIGFQFHPEKMLCTDKEEIFRKIFENIELLARRLAD